MAIKTGGFSRKSKASDEIPSSSLADIAFLLLIFFMVTTVFRTSKERPIEWAAAAASEKIDEKREDIMHVWVERNGRRVGERPQHHHVHACRTSWRRRTRPRTGAW